MGKRTRISVWGLERPGSLVNNCLLNPFFSISCETWRSTKALHKTLQVFGKRCLTSILGIQWPNTISSEELLRKTNEESIITSIKRRKWGWIGHTLRRGSTNIARQALDYHPQVNRRSMQQELGKSQTELTPYARPSLGGGENTRRIEPDPTPVGTLWAKNYDVLSTNVYSHSNNYLTIIYSLVFFYSQWRANYWDMI